MTDHHRQATLVIISNAGVVRGEVGPLKLLTPWWHESGPVGDYLPASVVLRLLHADPMRTNEMGGDVTYLVEYDGPMPAPLQLRPTSMDPLDATDHRHPLRHPWAEVGGPAADLAWVANRVQLDLSRPPRQERTWNLSTIWSIPVVDDDGAATVWLKCVPPMFAHEPAVLQIMADQAVPELLDHDRHRMLLADMPGHDGHSPTADAEIAMVDALVDIQLTSSSRLDELLAAGVPDLRTPRLIEELTSLVSRLAANDPVLQTFVDGLPQRLAQIDAMGLPNVLAHGDPHGGNCRLGVAPPLWFDWGDSLIGNPLLDVASLHRMSDATIQHWLDRWADRVPGSDPHRIWKLLKPVALLRMAWVYQRFCDNIEPSEHVYHAADVLNSLDETRRFLTGDSE